MDVILSQFLDRFLLPHPLRTFPFDHTRLPMFPRCLLTQAEYETLVQLIFEWAKPFVMLANLSTQIRFKHSERGQPAKLVVDRI